MLFKIGTVQELNQCKAELPQAVITELLGDLTNLDHEYGADRDWMEYGGYVVIIDSADDLPELMEIVNIEEYPCEWVGILDGGYISVFYLFNNEFGISVLMPAILAPDAVKREMEAMRK